MSAPLADRLRRRLGAARRRIVGAAVAHGALVTVAVLAALGGAAVAAEAGLWMGVELRTALFWLLAFVLVALLAVGVGVPLLRGAGVLSGLGERDVVRRAGQDHPGVSDRLATALDLADGRDSGDDGRLHAAALDALAAEVEAVPFERVQAFGPVRRVAPWAAVPAALVVLLFVLWPSAMSAAAGRLMAPGVYFAPPAPFALSVTPGDAEVTRGAAFEASVQAEGRDLPLTATLEYGRADERAVESVRLDAEAGTTGGTGFAHTVEAVRADLRYRFTADGVRTPWYTVRVVDRPLVRGVQVTVTPPGYSGRRARRLPEGVGDATGLAGSTVSVQVGHGGTPPVSGWLSVRWANGGAQRVPLRVGSEGARGAFRLRGAGTYTVHLKAANGLENTDPARYRLGSLDDAPPQIALVQGADGTLTDAGQRLTFRVTDDFGFRGGALVYRVTRGGEAGRTRSVALPVRPRPLDQDAALDWRVPGLRPGDVVELYGRVTDNGPRGQTARTPLVTLRFPSFSDRLDSLSARRDSTVDALDDLRRDAEQSGERFQRLREDIRQSLEPDWEDRRQVEELMREQSDMQRQAQDLRQQMEQLGQQMQETGLDESVQRQFDEMQRVMEELDSPEMRDALERLREAMEALDMRQMLEQSERAAQSEEEMRRRLERAMRLMERLEAAVAMEEAARRAEDLAETEERLAEETAEARENADEQSAAEQRAERERLASEQRQAREEADRLGEAMDEVEREMGDVPNAPTEAAQEMQEQMEGQDGLPQQMEENAEQLERGQMQDAHQGQQDMAQQLRQMAQRMRQQSQQMQGQQSQVDQAALRRALEDVLTISRDQEELADRVRQLPSQNPALVPAARRQSELRDALRTVVDTLRRVANTVPQLGPEIDTRAQNGRREMDAAVERLAERQSGASSGHQRAAMSHLNELALLLADVLDQIQSQQSQSGQGQRQGAGSPQQMQQMGEAQQRINQRIQQMLNEAAGERLSGDQARRMRQLGEQQEALRRQLERAIESGGLGEGERSALRRIEEQMRETARELRGGRVSQRTPPRQQEILQRLLEAERSANQRGREERREGETGAARPAPPASPPRTTRPADRVRGDLIRALESGYSADYQDLIKRYFERLQDRSQ